MILLKFNDFGEFCDFVNSWIQIPNFPNSCEIYHWISLKFPFGCQIAIQASYLFDKIWNKEALLVFVFCSFGNGGPHFDFVRMPVLRRSWSRRSGGTRNGTPWSRWSCRRSSNPSSYRTSTVVLRFCKTMCIFANRNQRMHFCKRECAILQKLCIFANPSVTQGGLTFGMLV